MAWHPLGWECVAVSEIEPFACSVLAHHYPKVPNLGDITKITEDQIKNLGPIDLVVAGFPCTDVSLAGKRAGLKNEDGTLTRSGLFFDGMRVVNYVRKHNGCRWLVVENVPGLYSSNGGRDFSAVVGEMVGASFGVPDGGWQDSGFCVGPEGLVEFSCLDAQFFSLAQRRERVFFVTDFGAWADRPPILLESESLRWYPAPSRKTGQRVAGTVKGGTGSRGYPDPSDGNGGGLVGDRDGGAGDRGVACHQNTGQGYWNQSDTAATVRTPCGGDSIKANLGTLPEVANTSVGGTDTDKNHGKRSGSDRDTLVAFDAYNQQECKDGVIGIVREQHGTNSNVVACPEVVPSLTESGRGTSRTGESRGQDPVIAVSEVAHTIGARHDSSEDGTGRGLPLVAQQCAEVAPAVTSSGPPFERTGNSRVETEALIALSSTHSELSPTVTAHGSPFSRPGNPRVETDALVVSPTITSKMQGSSGWTPHNETAHLLACDTVGAMACNTGPRGHDAGNLACNQAVDAGYVIPPTQQPIPIDMRNASRSPDKKDTINRQGVGVGEAGDPAPTVSRGPVPAVACSVTPTHEVVGALCADGGTAKKHGAGGLTSIQHMLSGYIQPVECKPNSEDLSPTVTSKWMKGNGGPAGSETQNLVLTTPEQQVTAFAQNTRDEVRVQGDGQISGAVAAEPGMKQTTYLAIRTANTNANGHGIQEELAHTLDKAQGQAVACPESKAVGTDCYNGQITGDVAATLGTPGSSVNASGPTVMTNEPLGFYPIDDGQGSGRNLSPTVRCGSGGSSGNPPGVVQTILESVAPTCTAFNMDSRSPQSAEQQQAVKEVYSQTLQVRRLTCVEVERLQGFSDNFTKIPYRKKSASTCPDGPRYKVLGNSFAVPVVRWIGVQIERCLKGQLRWKAKEQGSAFDL